jgi:hypothetical protein
LVEVSTGIKVVSNTKVDITEPPVPQGVAGIWTEFQALIPRKMLWKPGEVAAVEQPGNPGMMTLLTSVRSVQGMPPAGMEGHLSVASNGGEVHCVEKILMNRSRSPAWRGELMAKETPANKNT